MNHLEAWGFGAVHRDAFDALAADDLMPARIIEEQRDGYTVRDSFGTVRAHPSGRLRHHAAGRDALPAVGDWVAVQPPRNGGRAVIHHVLPRRTALVRKEAGRTVTAQVVAANVDIVFVVTSLNGDLGPRRIERYLAAVWDSGATPVLLLNKADVCADAQAVLVDLEPIVLGVPVLVLSALHGEGLDALDAHLQPALTVLLVGSSGVGKSTILNRLMGEDVQPVHVIRARDERGQHTTTARRLLQLPSGALLVDTPGMRELALWDAEEGLDEAFDDVTKLSMACRFRDCGHVSEPGCAVRDAIDDGRLTPERLEAWRKLQRELAFVRSKQDQRARLEAKRAQHRFTKRIRVRTQELKRRKGL